MSLARDSRQERKLKAVLRAQFSLKQKLERIDHDEDVVSPIIERLKSGKAVPELGLLEGAVFDIQVESANPNPDPNANGQ